MDVSALLSSDQWGFVVVGFVCVCVLVFGFFFNLNKLMRTLLTTYIWTDAVSCPFTIDIFLSENKAVC